MACQHFAIVDKGEIVCKLCHAFWRIDLEGARWIEPDSISVSYSGSCWIEEPDGIERAQMESAFPSLTGGDQ